MAPNADCEIRKSKVGGMNVKRYFSKLLSSKKKIVRKKDGDHLVFDALPDESRQVNKSSEESIHNMNTDTGAKVDSDQRNYNEKPSCKDPTDECPTISDDEENEDDANSEEKNKSYKKRRQKCYTNRSKAFGSKNCPPVIYQTNMTINGGTGMHFGSSKTIVNTINYNTTPAKPMNDPKEPSPGVNALMNSEVKLEPAHLNVLSEHFGKNWKKIGVTLGFTVGELNSIKEKYGTQSSQEKGFQMLQVWCRKTGKKATIGALCSKLWYTNIDSARDAVEQLSQKIDDI